MDDATLTEIYNRANGITTKNPPLSTRNIFRAMQLAFDLGRLEMPRVPPQGADQEQLGIWIVGAELHAFQESTGCDNAREYMVKQEVKP